MKLRNKQNRSGEETLSASEVRRRLGENYEGLNAVMESSYLLYLNPETVARIQSIVGRR